MTSPKVQIIAAVLGMGLLFATQAAHAHCDSLDGPVAKAVNKALESGNANPVLAYAPATVEAEIVAAFDRSRKVRGLNADAKALADQAFMETVIRLHRAGEGAAYTGLKSAGADYGPVIPAAEQAVETGDSTKLEAVLVEEIKHSLHERIAHVRALREAPLEPMTAAEVPDARARISAEFGFITFSETLRQAAHGKGAVPHAD
jgi:hypothetical protein